MNNMTMDKLKMVLLLYPPFALLTAVSYLIGRWSVFRFNAFEYVSLEQMLLMAIPPLLICLVAGVIAAGI